MNYTKSALALLVGLAMTVTLLILLSSFNTQEAAATINSVDDGDPDARQGLEHTTLTGAQLSLARDSQLNQTDGEACTIAIAAGSATTDGRPVLWKNRDYYGRADAWQSILFWHEATSHTFSISDTFGDRFN